MATTHVICAFENAVGYTQGHMELHISEPLAVGSYQTAPVFEARYELDPEWGNAVLMDLPQRGAGETWYFVLMVYPTTSDCSRTGAIQFRFYIPEGEAQVATLTYLLENYSAW